MLNALIQTVIRVLRVVNIIRQIAHTHDIAFKMATLIHVINHDTFEF